MRELIPDRVLEEVERVRFDRHPGFDALLSPDVPKEIRAFCVSPWRDIYQLLVEFKNGLQVSVLTGDSPIIHNTESEPYEAAIYDPNAETLEEPEGYLDAEDVRAVLARAAHGKPLPPND